MTMQQWFSYPSQEQYCQSIPVVLVRFTSDIACQAAMSEDNSDQGPRNLSQNTYIFVWMVASLASLAIFIRFF